MKINAEQQLLANAISNLPVSWCAQIDEGLEHNGDARLTLGLTTRKYAFRVECKRIHRKESLIQYHNQAEHNDSNLLICNLLSPFLRRYCQELGINYIDEAGNAYIALDDVYIWIQGRLPDAIPSQTASLSPGIAKCLFALFAEEDLLRKTYSEIATKAGISLGMVNKAIQYLIEHKHIPQHKSQRRFLSVESLQYLWLQAYVQVLRPKLEILTVITTHDWTSIGLENDDLWSGEVAAFQQIGYLSPEQGLLFTRAPFQQKLKLYQARPGKDGTLILAHPFWGEKLTLNGRARALLMVAELLASGDDRNREVAGIINDQYLHLKQLP